MKVQKKVQFIIVFLFIAIHSFASIKYVKPTISGSGDGSSWANASGDLRTTLTAAVNGDIIWVAAGTYKPTTGTDRSLSFVIPSGVKVYGGFSGNESNGFNLFQRDFEANESILSGEIGGSVIADNTHHVVSTHNVSDQTIVDGFTITKGYGIGGTDFGNGGGWLNVGSSTPQIKNIKFIENTGSSGGALYNNGFNGNASPFISNCVFIDNYATNNGGAVYNRGSSGVAQTYFSNCTFYQNDADGLGGAIYNFNVSFISIRNSILWDNKQLVATSVPVTNDFYNDGTSPNSTTVVNYSIISESGCPQNGGTTICSNVNSGNPNFLNAALGDLRLTESSALALNNGLNTSVITKNDLSNNLRIRNDVVDRGAYEYAGTPTKIFVDQSVTSNSLGHSWDNALTNLHDALAFSLAGESIWVAKGTYKPTANTDRTVSFQIPDSVQVYGGFAGDELSNYDLANRDFITNETILSGDIGISNNDIDNAYNVIYTEGVSAETLLNGFTITKGNASETVSDRSRNGGGWYNDGVISGESHPTIWNCLFKENKASSKGGALYNNARAVGAKANPLIISCIFTLNNALNRGGAICNDGYTGQSNPVMTGCVFNNNSASFGGAINNEGNSGESSPILTNCIFRSNTSSSNGGAINMYGSNGNLSSILTNCLFSKNGGNHIAYYSGMANTQPHFINCTFYGATQNTLDITYFPAGSTPIDFTNCIFWNNNQDITDNNNAVNITYSIVEEVLFTQGAFVGSNNLNLPPNFVDPTNGIFNINCASAAINAGTSSGAPTTDITGFSRTNNPDAGAYEYGYAIIENDVSPSLYTPIQGVPHITAQSKIQNDNNVLIQGINSVLLSPGFEVAPELGGGSNPTVFNAEIGGGCGN